MRGKDHQQADMFSYLSPEQRVRQDHPLRAIRAMADEALCEHVGPIRRDVRQDRAPVDSAGEVAARAADSDAVLGAQRTAADGRDRLQRAVPLVRGHEYGRAGVGRDRVHQEPRPAVGWRRGAGVSSEVVQPGAGEEPDQRRALHGGRHADGSLGELEELSAQG